MVQCAATTQSETQCRRHALTGDKHCRQHGGRLPHEPGNYWPTMQEERVPMGYYCGVVLPELAARVELMPDPTKTQADADFTRWIWVDHEQAFCQLYNTGAVAVRCDCSACSHDVSVNRAPTRSGHCIACECLDCVCKARVLIDKFDETAGPVVAGPHSMCGCSSCYTPPPPQLPGAAWAVALADDEGIADD